MFGENFIQVTVFYKCLWSDRTDTVQTSIVRNGSEIQRIFPAAGQSLGGPEGIRQRFGAPEVAPSVGLLQLYRERCSEVFLSLPLLIIPFIRCFIAKVISLIFVEKYSKSEEENKNFIHIPSQNITSANNLWYIVIQCVCLLKTFKMRSLLWFTLRPAFPS